MRRELQGSVDGSHVHNVYKIKLLCYVALASPHRGISTCGAFIDIETDFQWTLEMAADKKISVIIPVIAGVFDKHNYKAIN